MTLYGVFAKGGLEGKRPTNIIGHRIVLYRWTKHPDDDNDDDEIEERGGGFAGFTINYIDYPQGELNYIFEHASV